MSDMGDMGDKGDMDHMGDEGTRNVIGPGDARAHAGVPPGANGSAPADRGMPELGQHRSSGRPRVWWLTPLAIVVIVVIGAVWTVHGFLARHDADAKARRDAALDQPDNGRVFADGHGQAASAASAPASVAVTSASSLQAASAPAATAGHLSPAVVRTTPVRSYLDAPLIATGDSGGFRTESLLSGAASPVADTSDTSPVALKPAQSGSLAARSLVQVLTPGATPRVLASRLGDRNFILAQGAKIDCVGDTAFDSSEAGISTCTVTKNVYSDNGHVVLIERGSQVNSEYRTNPAPGQRRVFILSARIRTPDGVSVDTGSPAADALGRMGIGGHVNNRWGERVGAAFLLSLTHDAIGYLATRGGNSNSSTVFENTRQSGDDMAARVLDSTINIAPTLTQSQGAEFTIVLARDLDFSAVYALQPEAGR